MTPREAARYLRRSRASIMAMLRKGQLGAILMPGKVRRYVILPEHIADFARRHAAAPLPKPARQRRTQRPSLIDQLLPD
jgi:excisionase family DNA binding protein